MSTASKTRNNAHELHAHPLLHALVTGSFHDVLWPLILAAGALTLTLATIGNLGLSALVIGPLLGLALVAGRIVLSLSAAADSFSHLQDG